MLTYLSIFEYVHNQVDKNITNSVQKNDLYNEYKNIVTSPKMTDYIFIEVINNYFFDVGLNNASLSNLKEPVKYVGIKVRATKDALIVTEVIDDIRFVVGDEIVTLSGDDINYCRKRYRRQLGDVPLHREEWQNILTYQNSIEVLRSNQRYSFELKHFEYKEEQNINVFLRDDTPVVQFNGDVSFDQTAEALHRLSRYDQSYEKVIFDLRKSTFENFSIAEFLIPYFFEIGLTNSIDTSEVQVKIENGRHRQLYKNKIEKMLLKANDVNEQAFFQNLLDQPIGDWQYFNQNKLTFIGLSRFENVIILVDKETEKTAEWLTHIALQSNIVTTVGRPTRGNMYSFKYVDEKIDNRFLLKHMISEHENKTADDAIYPDKVIEWSKRHAIVDLDIKFTIDNG